VSEVGRRGDLIARVGGEEFAWILPETDLPGAVRVPERARRAASVVAVPGVGHVTISIGVAELAQTSDPAELYRLADEALYHAKRSGRDRCVAYDADVPSATPPVWARPVTSAAVARSLSRAIDARDPAVRAHCERVAHLVERMAVAAGWPAARATLLCEAALVHEIGMLGMSPHLRHAPGPLTGVEARDLRRHLVLGAEILTDVMAPEQVSWVRGQAERWDGSGTPDGLGGARVPEGARLLAVADAWDVLSAGGTARAGTALATIAGRTGTWYAPGAVVHLHTARGAGTP